jgi:transcriptional regulator with XRE-family HTH domain
MATKKTVRSKSTRPAKPAAKSAPEAPLPSTMPNVGQVLKRMRMQRGFTVRDVAAASDLSPSFLSAVERGASDISLGRLSRIAQFFEHDIGSLLGYSTRLGQPKFVDKMDRVQIDRGKGVEYELLRLTGLNLELQRIVLEPKSSFREELVHEGVDIVLVIEGQIVLSVDGIDYPMMVGECATYGAAFRHRIRNDTNRRASAVAFTTGRML